MFELLYQERTRERENERTRERENERTRKHVRSTYNNDTKKSKMHHTDTRGEEEEEHRWEWLLYALQLPSLCGVNHGTGTVCRNFRKPHRLRAGGITKSEVAVGGRERTGQHSVPPPPPPRRCLAKGVATPKRRRVGLVHRAAGEVGGCFIYFLSQMFFTHVLFYRNSNSFQMFGSKEKEETQREQSEQCKQREERPLYWYSPWSQL